MEDAALAGTPLGAQVRLLHGASYGAVRAEGAFASAAALSAAAAFVRALPTFGDADAACVIAPKAEVQYPQVWYGSLGWPEALPPDANGTFLELHVRRPPGETTTYFMVRLPRSMHALGTHARSSSSPSNQPSRQPDVGGGVLGQPVRLPPDSALLELSLFA